MDELRVLQVVTDTDRRGAQVFAVDLEGALVERGVSVTTVALRNGRVGGLELEALGAARLAPSTLLALRRRAHDHDVVVGHGSSTLAAGALALAGHHRPFVYRQISDPIFWAPTRARRARVRMYYRRPDAVVALSNRARGILTETFDVPSHRLAVIPNGVPAREFQPTTDEDRRAARARFGLEPDDSVVLYAGSLVPEKGVAVLVDSINSIAAVAESPRLRLLVAGDGPERESLEARASEAGSRIRFVGQLAAMRDAFAVADLLVLPSLGGDSMPAVLIEAGFMGLPSVSTPVGAIRDIVMDGVTGRIVAPGDAAALASAILELAGTETGRQFGAAARTHCLAKFEIGVVADQWLDVLNRASA